MLRILDPNWGITMAKKTKNSHWVAALAVLTVLLAGCAEKANTPEAGSGALSLAETFGGGSIRSDSSGSRCGPVFRNANWVAKGDAMPTGLDVQYWAAPHLLDA